MTHEVKTILSTLEKKKSQHNLDGMARFGINTHLAFGVSNKDLREIAKEVGRNHTLALELWDTGYHEAKILAALVDEVEKVTETQLDEWVAGFDSWDVCDTVCGSLFDKTPFAYKKAQEWARNEKEFVRRAGFAMMAWLAVHDKKHDDQTFVEFLPIIKEYSMDERNFVRKAVNWALRQIGKRNPELKKKAIKTSEELLKLNNKTASWIAKDAIRELKNK